MSVLVLLLDHELHLLLDLGALLHFRKKSLATLATAGVCSVAPWQGGRSLSALQQLFRRKRVRAGVCMLSWTSSKRRVLGSMTGAWKRGPSKKKYVSLGSNTYLPSLQTFPPLFFHMSTFVSQRARTSNVEVEAPPPPAPSSMIPIVIPTALPSCSKPVPRGFLPLLLYSSFFFLVPFFYEEMDYDYTDDVTRIGVISISAIGALILIVGCDVAVYFNSVLFAHTALELAVIKVLLDFIDDENLVVKESASGEKLSNADGDKVLAWVAMIIIIGHLIPFFVLDNPRVLGAIAAAGVVLNTTVVTYLDHHNLDIVAFSTVVLMGFTLLLQFTTCKEFTLLSSLRHALMKRTCLIY